MKILFVLSTMLLGFVIGLLYGTAVVPRGTGLAGPTEVLGWALSVGIISLVLSMVINRKLNATIRKKITILFFLMSLIPVCWFVYKYVSRPPQDDSLPPMPYTATPVSWKYQEPIRDIGIGMARPDFFNHRVLYFYSSPNLEKDVTEHTPVDSLVFEQSEHQYSIVYAPPWFFPQHMKMDYEILYLKIVKMGIDWMEIEVNRQNGQTAWVSSSGFNLWHWTDFLLRVHSVENLNVQVNPLRVNSFDHASTWKGPEYELMSPMMINDHWMKVSLLNHDMKSVGVAWLRWRDDKKLLISYSLLS